MKRHLFVIATVYLILLLPVTVHCQPAQSHQSDFDRVNWQRGPCTGNIGNIARIQIPPGYLFAGQQDARFIMERLLQDIYEGNEVGFVFSKDWFVAFQFDESGYVRDDEKNKLDANAMLKAIKENNEKANAERKRRGLPTIELIGWVFEPFYNSSTHNLEWSINGRNESGELIVNYNTRYLGRKGVMRVVLVSDAAQLSVVLPEFRELMKTFDYNRGQRYTEFVQGDKVAEYGLTALVVGGAAAAAAKGGFFKWAWKLIAAAVIGILAFVRSIFRRLFGRSAEA